MNHSSRGSKRMGRALLVSTALLVTVFCVAPDLAKGRTPQADTFVEQPSHHGNGAMFAGAFIVWLGILILVYLQFFARARKRVKQPIQSEAILRTLIDNLQQPAFLKDTQLRYVAVNEALCRLLRKRRASIVGKTDHDICPVEQADKHRTDDLRVLETGRPSRTGNRDRTRDRPGRTDVVRIPVKDDGGRVTGVLGVFEDLIGRKRTGERPTRTEALLKAVVEQSPIPIAIASPNGTVEIFNDACKQALGIEDEPDVRPGANLATLRALWKDYEADGRPIPVTKLPLVLSLQGKATTQKEQRVVRRDGTERWILVNAAPVRNPSGDLIAGIVTFPDITDRKKMETALHESLTKYRILFDTLPLGITVTDREGNIREVNAASEEMLGLGRSLHTRRNIASSEWRLIREDGTPMPHEEYAGIRALRGEETVANLLTGLVGSDGLVKWLSVSASPIPLEGYGVAIIYTDVTRQREADEQIRQERNFSDTLINSLPGIFFLYDEENHLVRWNRRYAEVSGYSTDELLGIGILDDVPEEDRGRFSEKIQELYRAGETSAEGHILTKSGRKIPCLFTAKLLTVGNRRYILGTGIDITDRKRADDTLKRTVDRQARLSRLFQEDLFALDTLDARLRGITDAVVEAFGADFCRIWVIEPGDLCDSGCVHAAATEGPHVCVHRDRCLRLAASSGRYTHRDGPMHQRVPFGCYKIGRVAAGEDRKFLTNDVANDPRIHDHQWARDLGLVSFAGYRLVSSNGATMGVLALFAKHRIEPDEDSLLESVATSCSHVIQSAMAEEERRKLEAQIQYAQKLESLGILAGGIAHDFNNLLTGILGNAGLALMDMSAESPGRHSVEQIELAARRAAELTNQMLAYSGRGRFVVQQLDIARLVEEMAHLLQAAISKKVVLRYNVARNLPAIEADSAQIRQVVMNLITNASDAIGDKSGVVTLSTGVMLADKGYLAQSYLNEDLPEGEYVFVEVADTGCGMDEATKARIFDPFFTTKFTGRGLGLAAVLGIVRGHRGAIHVYSEPGRGSSIKVLLPSYGQATQTVAESMRASVPWSGSGTILVVDDEASVRRVARHTLERCGLQVIVAENGREGIETFRQRPSEFAAVILDLTMPDIDGQEAFAELRQIRPDVRVILSSGFSEVDVENRFAGQGLSGFLQKPYHPSELIEKVRTALQA